MPGTWLGLETSRRGMMVQQRALDTTGHNLANATTQGYSRQEVVIIPTDAYSNPTWDSSVTPGQLGTGTDVNMIRRVINEYLDHQMRRTNTDTSYWEEQISVLERAEASFAEPSSEGIGDSIVDLYKGWMDLNNTPQDPGIKAAVVQLGDALATLMSYTYNQLEDVQNTVADITDVSGSPEITTGMQKQQVDRVNEILVQVRDLTVSIKKIYELNQQPNDLLDKRDQLLEELSKYAPVSVTYETRAGKPPTGEISQLTFMGVDLDLNCIGDETLSLSTDGDTVTLSIDGTELNLTDNRYDIAQGGSFLGVERARQDLIRFKAMLNDIAINLRDKISAQLGQDFFTGDLATGDFAVNSELVDDPSQLDGTKAQLVSNTRGEDIDADRPYTIEEYFSILLTDLAGCVKGVNDMAANQAAIKKQITDLRDSVAGVSMDEELTKMLQFQYGFQASARMINALDGMLDVIINKLF
jgi:flagellar hook-associated protein 1 FlgK